MTNQDILTLAKAGFTAQQIAALNAVKSAEATITTVAAPQTTNGSLEQINQQLQALTGQMQTNALAFMQQPAPQDTDSILAEIINPPGVVVKKEA